MPFKVPNLRPLLMPRSIAVIGATSNPDNPISKYVHQLVSNGYTGQIYPINPKYQELYGYKCHPSVRSIPGEIDTASIALRNDAVLSPLHECAEKGVKSAILFSAGFAETGQDGKRLQEKVTEISQKTGMRILGPNCNGVINISDRAVMALFFYSDMKEKLIPGVVSLVSQSGTIPLVCFANALERGIGFRCLVSVGNEADLDISDLIGFMLEDEQTKVVTGYVEGFRDVRKFMDVMDLSRRRKKPVILLHATRYPESLFAAKCHTGAYTEAHYDINSIFREKKVPTVEEPDDLLEYGMLFSISKKPAGGRLGIMNTTGGLNVLTADVGAELGLEIPPFSDSTHAMFGEMLKFGTPSNPIDLTGQVASDPVLFNRSLRAFAEEDRFDIVVISMFLWKSNLEYRIDSLIEVSRQTHKPIVVIWVGANLGCESARKLLRADIPVFRTVRGCLKGIKSWIDYYVS